MNQTTLQQMYEMRLYVIQTALKALITTPSFASFTKDETASQLIQNEWDDHKYSFLQRNIKTAKFRYVAKKDGVDFSTFREFDKNQTDRLFSCDFIKSELMYLLQ